MYERLTRFGDFVGYVAWTVFAVGEVDFSFAGSFDGDGQLAASGFPGPHVELVEFTLFTPFQADTAGFNQMGTVVSVWAHCELERGSWKAEIVIKTNKQDKSVLVLTGNMDVLVFDGNSVHTKFFGDEVDGVQSIADFIDFSILDYSTRRCDSWAQIERGDS